MPKVRPRSARNSSTSLSSSAGSDDDLFGSEIELLLVTIERRLDRTIGRVTLDLAELLDRVNMEERRNPRVTGASSLL